MNRWCQSPCTPNMRVVRATLVRERKRAIGEDLLLAMKDTRRACGMCQSKKESRSGPGARAPFQNLKTDPEIGNNQAWEWVFLTIIKFSSSFQIIEGL